MLVSTVVPLLLVLGKYVLATMSNDIVSAIRNGLPLFLTPYITTGQIPEAKALAKVGPLFQGQGESYSGYLTVRPEGNANLFFWFFPAVKNPSMAPVVVWLQGGPGSTSLIGLFIGNGPYKITEAGTIKLNTFSWRNTHSMIYIDSPVGAGFSFSNNGGRTHTTEEMASDLYTALTQFFTLFAEYSGRDLFLAGESYSGKVVAVLGEKIHRGNHESRSLLLNLKGILIGDGVLNPIHNYVHKGDYLYNLGLIDHRQQLKFYQYEAKIKRAIKRRQWNTCTKVFTNLIVGGTSTPTLFAATTGYSNVYNVLQADQPPDWKYFGKFVQLSSVRQAIHVGSEVYHGFVNPAVNADYAVDYCQSAVPSLVELLEADEHYRVLVFHGNLDPILTVTGASKVLRRLRWSGATAYLRAPKTLWRVDGKLAGYVRKGRNLMFIVVRNAGHVVIYDQQKISLELINKFTSGGEFS